MSLKSNFKYAFDPDAGIMRLDVDLLCNGLFDDVQLSYFLRYDIYLWHSGAGSCNVRRFLLFAVEMAILLFILNVAITLSVERNEFNFSNILLTFVMLFTYAKMWVLVVLNGFIQGMFGCTLIKRKLSGTKRNALRK